MFEQSESVKTFYEKFAGLDNSSEMWAADILGIHGLAVMTTIDDIISNLEDNDCAIDLLIEQGHAHAQMGMGTTGEIFWVRN